MEWKNLEVSDRLRAARELRCINLMLTGYSEKKGLKKMQEVYNSEVQNTDTLPGNEQNKQSSSVTPENRQSGSVTLNEIATDADGDALRKEIEDARKPHLLSKRLRTVKETENIIADYHGDYSFLKGMVDTFMGKTTDFLLHWKMYYLRRMCEWSQWYQLQDAVKNPDLAAAVEYSIRQAPWALTLSTDNWKNAMGNQKKSPATGKIKTVWSLENPFEANGVFRGVLANSAQRPVFDTGHIFVNTNLTAKQWVNMVQVLDSLNDYYFTYRKTIMGDFFDVLNTMRMRGADSATVENFIRNTVQDVYYIDGTGTEWDLLKTLTGVLFNIDDINDRRLEGRSGGAHYLVYIWAQAIVYYIRSSNQFKLLFCKPEGEKNLKPAIVNPMAEIIEDAPTDIFRLMEQHGFRNVEKMNMIDFLTAQVLMLKQQIRRAKKDGVKPLDISVKTGIPLTIVSSL